MPTRSSVLVGPRRSSSVRDCCLLIPIATGLLADRVLAQRVVFATHDWSQLGAATPQPETWADVKSVGNGRTYSVGTTKMRSVVANPNDFSTRPVSYPPIPPGVIGNPAKDAVIIQAAEPGAPAGIAWQATFFGYVGTSWLGATGRNTFARAISVWPGVDAAGNPDHSATRIAICGETFDPELPLQATAVNPNWSSTGATPPTGFIAVYDGDGNLHWSYHFYGQGNSTTTITDVSIRVVTVAGETRDYVTYCGASTYGNPPSSCLSFGVNTLSPVNPFPAPPVLVADVFAGGDADNGTQWDGMVGRVSAVHLATAPTTAPPVRREFHSIVGGAGNDVLLGISEKDFTEFTVAGVTSKYGALPGQQCVPAAPLAFPLTTDVGFNGTVDFGSLIASSANWEMGVVLTFISAQLSPASAGMALFLTGSCVIGDTAHATIAKDVLWHGGRIYAVGSTTDPDFSRALLQDAGTLTGSASGFVVATVDPNIGIQFARYTEQPTNDQIRSGRTGIAAWNEHSDHVVVTGWREYEPSLQVSTRVDVTSYFVDGANGFVAPHRTHVIDGAPPANKRRDFPAGSGFTYPLQAFGPFTGPSSAAPLGPMIGGGAAVDPRGRVWVVGDSMLVDGAPELPMAGPAAETRPTTGGNLTPHCVRIGVDMLPDNVCRTDSTGLCPAGGPASYISSAGGGTTPGCATRWYGQLVPPPAFGPPPLARMFMDLLGDPAAGGNIEIVVDRPPGGALVLGYVQLGFPNANPLPIWPGIEVWSNGSTPWTMVALPVGQSVRVPWTNLPAGSHAFSTQFISFVTQPFCNDPNWIYAASPGLIFGY